jgi:hypothetical protein
MDVLLRVAGNELFYCVLLATTALNTVPHVALMVFFKAEE